MAIKRLFYNVLIFSLAFVASHALAQELTTNDAGLYEAAKKEGGLVWYVSAPIDAMRAVANEFEKKYPGVTVQIIRLPSVQQYARFLEEVKAKRYTADILQITDYPSMASLVQEKLVAEWRMPTADRIPDEYRIKNFAYTAATTEIVIVYNTNKVTPEEVKILASGWDSVLDPRFNNRIAITSNVCGACYANVQMFLDPKYKGRFGWPFLEKVVKQNPTNYSDIAIALDRVISGEQDILFWVWEAAAVAKWQQGAPIRWVRPAPSVVFGNNWQAIPNFAPHPNAARLFQNWSFSEDGMRVYQLKYGAATVLKDYPDIRAVVKEPWYMPVKEPYAIDRTVWEKNFERDMGLWQKLAKSATH